LLPAAGLSHNGHVRRRVPSGLIDGAPRVGAEIVVHDDVIALRSARAGAGGDPRGDLTLASDMVSCLFRSAQ
jgi:hypothetical protein